MKKNNKILLVKMERGPMTNPPFALLYIANALEQKGFVVEIFHEIYNEEAIERLVNYIDKSENLLFIGFSVYTGIGFKETIETTKIIHPISPVPIVWGGVHPSLLPRNTLEEDFVDIVVMGEGEIAVQELATALKNGISLDEIKGLGFKKNGDIIINEPRDFIKDLDKFSPSWHLIDIERYTNIQKGCRVLRIMTSRGCPHRCAFCLNPVYNRRRWRGHSVEFVKKQVKFLKQYCDMLVFHDDNFFVDMRRALNIIKSINMPWSSQIRAELVNREFMEEIKGTHCRSLCIGGESGNPRVLRDIILKDSGVEDMIRCAKLFKEYGIRLKTTFMIGLPGETKEELFDTLDFINKLYSIYHVGIDLRIYRPYPGTKLWEIGKNKLPKNIEDWEKYHSGKCNLPWVKDKKLIENIVKCHDAWRWLGFNPRFKLKFFHFCLEIKIVDRVRRLIKKPEIEKRLE